MNVKARAKINLFLDVLGTRPDGYHEILTVMQSLELHDVLEVEMLPGSEILVDTSDPEVPRGSGNIVFKAAELLAKEYGLSRGAKIFINKKIPSAAGLAGGSSDAAAALMCLNALWGLNAGEVSLSRLGERIGADVPFCLAGKTALARGKGERLFALPSFSGVGVVLVKPPFGVSTAEVYSLYDTLPPIAGPGPEALLEALEGRDAPSVARLMYNALERVTASLHPEINIIKNSLMDAGAMGALMSGSGPTVFGLCAGPAEAAVLASRLRLPGCVVIATATV